MLPSNERVFRFNEKRKTTKPAPEPEKKLDIPSISKRFGMTEEEVEQMRAAWEQMKYQPYVPSGYILINDQPTNTIITTSTPVTYYTMAPISTMAPQASGWVQTNRPIEIGSSNQYTLWGAADGTSSSTGKL